jgi:hypothetical protein
MRSSIGASGTCRKDTCLTTTIRKLQPWRVVHHMRSHRADTGKKFIRPDSERLTDTLAVGDRGVADTFGTHTLSARRRAPFVAEEPQSIVLRPSSHRRRAGAGTRGGTVVEIPQDAKVHGTEGQARRPKSNAAQKRCKDEFGKCLETELRDYDGESTDRPGWGRGTRCSLCHLVCLRTGKLPDETPGGHTCAYWEFP